MISEIKVKVRIKSLQIKNIQGSNVQNSAATDQSTDSPNKSHEFAVSFVLVEKYDVCGETFFYGIKGTGSAANIVQFPSCRLEEIQTTQDLFNFMSVHSEETFIVTIEIEEDNNCGSGFPKLKEVKLIYD